MGWPIILGKIFLAVGTGVLIEHGDDIVKGIGDLFTDDPKTKKKPSVDAKMSAKQTLAKFGGSGLPKLSEDQARNAAAIAQVCNMLKIFTIEQRRSLCMALWVNAWYESKFKASAHNPNGEDSRGLFQINIRAHKKWSHIDLYNPLKNTAAILLLGFHDKRFIRAIQAESVADLTWVICRWVERPRHPEKKADRRKATAIKWYGNV